MSSQAAAPPLVRAIGRRWHQAYTVSATARPLHVLGGLVLVQWLAVLALALTVKHNGWLYYAGGDQLWHYSGAFMLAHGHLPPAFVGYGWSIMLLPITWIAGPNLVSALSAMVLGNTLILLPLALLSVYGIAARIAGRVFGYFAAALWIVLPYLGIVFVEPGYHQKYTELTLPQLLGLTSVPDFPAMVALLIGAYFCLRAAESTGWHAPVAAGLAVGWSIAIKPSNSIFLVVPGLLFLIARWRALLPFVAGLAPSLITLALWKYRGLGELAAAPTETIRLAGSASDLLHRIHSPKLNSWAHLSQVTASLREHFWAARVMEWLPIAGCVGLLSRSRRAFLLVGGWFIVFLLAKGTYIPASVEDASFFRILMPAFPAYLLLTAAVVLLVPGVRARPAPLVRPFSGRAMTVSMLTAAAVFAVLPLGIIAATPQLHDGGRDALRVGDSMVPVSSAIALKARAKTGAAQLSWRPSRAGHSSFFYRIFRAPKANSGVSCANTLGSASDDCRLFMDSPGVTRLTSFTDQPGKGTWTYRIGVASNWLNDPRLGDVYVISAPVTVTVP